MRRFFGSKGSKSEQSDKGSTEVLEEEPGAGEEPEEAKDMEGDRSKRKSQRQRSEEKAEDPEGGRGDADKKGRKGRGIGKMEETKPKVFGRKQKSVSEDVVEKVEESPEETAMEFLKPPRPLPRRTQRGSGSLFSESEEENGGDRGGDRSESAEEEEVQEVQEAPKRKGKGKEAKKPPIPKKLPRSRPAVKPDSGSEANVAQFVSVKDSNVPKLEAAKGGHYFSSVCNYQEPLSNFQFRARLLKYPAVTEQQLWTGEMAVVDERVFQWQEKVFSKSEAKKYQKLENCYTDQEHKYHNQLGQSSKATGKYLYSYVTQDFYTAKKKMKLLTRRCPVPHTKEKSFPRGTLENTSRSLNSDGESFDLEAGDDNDFFSDDSIEFEEPMSSSTPVPSRKKEKGGGDAAAAKAEKKAREKKEKETKEVERRSQKLKEVRAKREKEEEKRRQLEEAKGEEKAKKWEAMESKEKELKAAFVKKYKYSKRPSVPLGARMRSVGLSPSPGKLTRKKKRDTVSRSSEISEDLQGSAQSLEGGGGKGTSKVGTEYGERYPSRKWGGEAVGESGRFRDRVGYKNAEVMYIMASIPYLPGRCREVVICSILKVPGQQVLVFKPALGYRNIEAKRNNVFRISCEMCAVEEPEVPKLRRSVKKKGGFEDAKISEELGVFENVPKNEFRLSVLGEIATAEGFEACPLCIYYAIDIPKGWRNDSLLSNTEGMTHTCFPNNQGLAHFSHEFSFQLVFSMDFIDEPDPSRNFPTPTIALMAVSMNHPSPRIVYEGYGYVTIPMTPGCHFVKIRMWKPRARTVFEKMRATFLDISPSLQDMKLAHITGTDSDDYSKANLIGLQTEPSGTVKLRLHVIHQTPSSNKEFESNLDLLEKMSSATILKSVQAVIQAFQRARQKAENLKSQYD